MQLPHVFGGHPYFNEFLNPVVKTAEHIDTNIALKEWMLLGATVVGLAIIYAVTKKYYAVDKVEGESTGFKKMLENKWYVDELYDSIIVKPVQSLAKYFNNVLERKGIDGFVNGVGKAVNYSSRQIRLIQTGQVGTYILLMVLGILILFIVQLFL